MASNQHALPGPLLTHFPRNYELVRVARPLGKDMGPWSNLEKTSNYSLRATYSATKRAIMIAT